MWRVKKESGLAVTLLDCQQEVSLCLILLVDLGLTRLNLKTAVALKLVYIKTRLHFWQFPS